MSLAKFGTLLREEYYRKLWEDYPEWHISSIIEVAKLQNDLRKSSMIKDFTDKIPKDTREKIICMLEYFDFTVWTIKSGMDDGPETIMICWA